ncbi:F-box only protein 9 [Topomyia yanbarensis]|uniref:F-box only protein 9 n=1 Tax=Topomyia yanbarensis TaxID=2498891 RepID=UPI00273CF089|nr:F-box only protein 9 [Topomyia yanbarensis]
MDSTGDTGKEDDDESSSNVQSALEDFREKWQQELAGGGSSSQKNLPPPCSTLIDKEVVSVEQQAKTLFLQGSELERTGKVFEAMRLYRRAVQLVPDIEFKVYDKKVPNRQLDRGNEATLPSGPTIDHSTTSIIESSLRDVENLDEVDLVMRFQTMLAKSGKLFESASAADRMLIATSAHFSDLPMELVLYILRWVVSNELDLRSLERFSKVCRGFYLLARDPEIWKRACIRVYGVNVGNLKGSPFSSWREMYINRPRVHFHGCYISRTSYLRLGENSFQDQFYRPVQLVEYFRYFRFFADGRVLMLTSPEEPQSCVTKLKPRYPAQNEILKGHYRLHNDVVIVAVQRNRPSGQNQRPGRKKEIESEYGEQTFYLELQVVSTSKRAFSQLHWRQYSMVQLRNSQEKTTTFELAPTKYPPLYFSRVKSYHQESDGPLK